MAERNVAPLAILDDFRRQPGVSASVMPKSTVDPRSITAELEMIVVRG